MSRLTTTQIIEKGAYLEPDFDPDSLTRPQLIGIFAYHGIQWASKDTKAELVKIFNAEIKGNGVKLRRQREETQATLASENGIVNGVTGSPASPPVCCSVRCQV